MADGPKDPIEELLPAYALNALGEDEQALVEGALERDPRYRASLADYLEALSQLAESQVVVLPPMSLRDRVLLSLRHQPADTSAEPQTRPATSVPRAGWGIAAALVLAVLGLGGATMVQSSRVDQLTGDMGALALTAAQTERALIAQKTEMETLVESTAQTERALIAQKTEMDTLVEAAAETEAKLVAQQELTYFVADESTSLVAMWPMATEASSDKPARGMLIQGPDSGRFLMTLSLKPLGEGSVYQAWAWEAEEQPYSVAVFEVDYSGFALIPIEFPDRGVEVGWFSVNVAGAGGDLWPTGEPVLAGRVDS